MDPDEDAYTTEIKVKINTLLWEVLPEKATLKEAEKAAMLLWEEVVRIRMKYEAKGAGS